VAQSSLPPALLGSPRSEKNGMSYIARADKIYKKKKKELTKLKNKTKTNK
jgi:hypothetical protein